MCEDCADADADADPAAGAIATRRPGGPADGSMMRARDGGAAAGTSGSSGSSQASGTTGATRRRLLLAGSAGAASVLLAGCSTAGRRARTIGPDPFTLGVASGYPTPEGVVLWTRLAPGLRPLRAPPMNPSCPAGSASTWEVARDEGMRASSPAAGSTRLPTAPTACMSRWRARAGTVVLVPFRRPRPSQPHRPHPHPAARASRRVPRLRLCVASCQNIEHGYFAAYRHLMATSPTCRPPRRLHLRRHLGPEPGAAAAAAESADAGRVSPPPCDLQARSGPAGSACAVSVGHGLGRPRGRQRLCRRELPSGSLPPALFLARRAAAYQAYYEHMPMPRRMAPAGPAMRIHTSLRIGDLATLLPARPPPVPQPAGLPDARPRRRQLGGRPRNARRCATRPAACSARDAGTVARRRVRALRHAAGTSSASRH